MMGKVTEGEQVMRTVKRYPLLKGQSFARQDLFGDRQQGGVFDLEIVREDAHIPILLGLRWICN